MARKRPAKKFSAVKAVKANARERVGQPKPQRVIDQIPRARLTGKAKHTPTLADLLADGEER